MCSSVLAPFECECEPEPDPEFECEKECWREPPTRPLPIEPTSDNFAKEFARERIAISIDIDDRDAAPSDCINDWARDRTEAPTLIERLERLLEEPE